MISVQQAIEFARRHFPEGPERLAEHLGVPVRESPMDGCDGWCLATGDKSIIRINSKLSPARKRFTLAHELGHVILGVPTVIGESLEDILGSNSTEERRVNELASELLIPTDIVKTSLPELPIVATALKKLAKKSKVSELSTAIRVCNLANQIGLDKAAVVLFDEDQVRWQWSKTLKTISNETAAKLLAESRKAAPRAFRHKRKQGDVIVASTIENPYFGSATLFVQLLPAEIGMNLSRSEKRKQLEEILFVNDGKLQRRMAGLMGAHKKRIANMTKEQAEADFWERNCKKLENTPVNSKQGREYVRLRISDWL